jgi:IstB-like ATP binding protein
MQHDTSPHRVMIAGRSVTAQCASLVLACSRRLFAQYYSRYTRFEAKHFLLEAVRFMRIHPVSTGWILPAWYDLFQKKELVDALLDRLRHRCIIIRINGPSLRAPPSEPNTPHHPPAHTAPTGGKPSRSRMLK